MLEQLTESEMQYPLRVRTAVPVQTIEAVAVIEPEWPERGDRGNADAGTSEEPGRVELSGGRVHVADIVEQVRVQRLVHAEAQFGGRGEERLAEREAGRAEIVRVGDVPEGRDGELVISAQLLAVLDTAEREFLREE